MLKSEKFFGKRDVAADAKSAQAFSDKTAGEKVANDKPASAGLSLATQASVTGPRAVPASIAAASNLSNAPAAGAEMRSKLTVGPNIKLKGVEITDCDTLVV